MRRHSFFLRLFVGSLVLVGLVATLAGVVSFRYLNDQYHQATLAHINQSADLAQRFFQHGWPMPDSEVDAGCKLLATPPLRLTFVGADGRVLGDSQVQPGDLPNHRTPDRPEILAALEGRPGQEVRYSDTQHSYLHYVARPVMHEGKVAGAVRVAMPVQAVAQGEDFIWHVLLVAAGAGALLAVVLGLLLSWIWYRPLRQIGATAAQLAAGNLSARAWITGDDELAKLAQALDDMRGSLAQQIAQITRQRQDLTAVLAGLGEAVVAVDSAGVIVVINSFAIDLLTDREGQAQNLAGQPLQNVISTPGILDAYHAAMAQPKTVSRQLEMDGRDGQRRVLEVRAARISSDPNSVVAGIIVARDVTETTRSAAMKAEFVANASHELRTPLATLRAAVDNLLLAGGDDPEELKHFAAILDRHVRRLEHMTNDLLDLHRLETGKAPVRKEPVHLAGLAEWARAQFSPAAADKRLDFAVRLEAPADGDRPWVSDRKLLELIVQNLIDNAVKFTPTGGKVDCLLQRPAPGGPAAQDVLVIRVSDTGCGIGPEDQGRVFERFYQVNTSRAREANARGTGLGLSIVKHAAESLGAKINLQSSPGEGTTMTVTVPASAV